MADAEIILTNASVEIDDEAVAVEGNSIVLIEGQGEYTVKAATKGGQVVPVSSLDVTTQIGQVKFEMPASIQSMNLSKDIKARGPGRVVRVSGTDAAGNRLGRTLTQAVMTNDPEKAVQNEGKIPMEFMGSPLQAS
jgi:hypothetical protein